MALAFHKPFQEKVYNSFCIKLLLCRIIKELMNRRKEQNLFWCRVAQSL